MLDTDFRRWDTKGITKLGDLFSNDSLMSFEQLTQKYQLPKQDFFRFLQIRHYITNRTTLMEHREISALEKLLFQQPGKVSLSLFYDVMRIMSPTNTQRVKRVWEKELSVTINEGTWEDIWSYAKKISICTRTKAIQFKITHRMHISPNHRHSFNPSLSPLSQM